LNLKHPFAGLYLQELQEERNINRYSTFALDEEVHTERRAGDVVHSDMYNSKHMEMGSVAMHFSVTLSKDCYFIHEA
jgi:hypothetical protein